jgi:hypothetical protein
MYEDERKQNRFTRLEDWLTNMFWYHYKWYFIIGVFALSLLIMSVVSFVKNVDYDWTVIYAHIGAGGSDKTAEIKDSFETNGSDITGNGKIQIAVTEALFDKQKGYYSLSGELTNSDNIIFVMDDAVIKLYQSLGYFKDAVYIDDLELWAGINDVPVKPYKLEDFAGYDYTQEDIDDSNSYRQGEHDKLITAAEMIIEKIK